jgi:N-acetylmuramoyl-L-alanine amidase
MEPLFHPWHVTPAHPEGEAEDTPRFRGKWSTAANEEHRTPFSPSRHYDPDNSQFHFTNLSLENDAQPYQRHARTTVDPDGYTAVRVNLPPIGFNKARVKIAVDDRPALPVIDLEVPAVVVIDPGHGGVLPESDAEKRAAGYKYSSSAGEWRLGGSATNHAEGNPSKTLEKNMTLDFSRLLRERFNKLRSDEDLKLKIKMTRDSDVNLTLAARANFARNYGADQLLRIHFNGYNKSARGVEIQLDKTGNVNESSDRMLGQRVVDAAYEALHNFDVGTRNRGVKSDRGLDVLSDPDLGNTTTFHPCRAVLLEVEFIDVTEVDQLLNTNANHETVRKSVMNAVADALLLDMRIQPSE